jgi:ribosomal protein S3
MGQKVNPIIFQINSKNNLWKSVYFAKNDEESSYYLFQDLSMRQALNTLFKKRGLILQDCIIKRSSTKLDVFIYFYVRANKKLKTLTRKTKIGKFRKRIHSKFKFKFDKKKKTKKKKNSLINKSSSILQKKTNFEKKVDRKRFVRAVLKNNILEKRLNTYYYLKAFFNKTDFKTKILKILVSYTEISKISVNFKNIQNNTIIPFTKKSGPKKMQTIIKELVRFSRQKFFKEAVEIMILIAHNPNNSKLLGDYIALHFRFMKKQNRFLTFLKRALNLFYKYDHNKWEGIKILISGRFNNKRRARGRFIQVGKVPLQTFDSKISYHRTEVFTKTAAFGIKVWICQKKNAVTTQEN